MRLLRQALVISLLVAACGRDEQGAGAPPSSTSPVARDVMTFDTQSESLAGPDRVLAGWTALAHAPGDAAGHNLVAFRLSPGTSPADFVAHLDTARATPLGASALGGPDTEAERVVVHLVAGRIVVACLTRDKQGHRHAARGEWRALEVVPRPAGDREPLPPQTTIDVEMGDFAFLTPPHWTAGQRYVRVRNTGRQDHLLLLARLKEGKRLADAMRDDENDALEPSIGVARTGPGESAYLPVVLTPGRYVLICMIPDATTGRPHVELGMMREVEVVTLVAAPAP